MVVQTGSDPPFPEMRQEAVPFIAFYYVEMHGMKFLEVAMRSDKRQFEEQIVIEVGPSPPFLVVGM
jgi:hypothetical protein